MDKIFGFNLKKVKKLKANNQGIEQKMMLDMSEQDIKSGKLISQEATDKRNLEWLNIM